MSSKKDFIVFESLVQKGETAEQAFLKATNDDMQDLVTKKDLKIAFFEFAKEYKLDNMNLKVNFLLWLNGTGFVVCVGLLAKIAFGL